MPFDYIIVGAGSAGCVLADRLSQDGRTQVLLIEAGSQNRSPLIRMPRGMARIWQDPRYYWPFPVERQDFRPPGETWFYGKGLGGSSAVNGTWYYRGQPKDFEAWAGMGAEGWSWREIERCYRELEDYRERDAAPGRGRGGRLTVTRSRSTSALTRALLEAGREGGLPVLDDVNQPGTEGVGRSQMTVDRRGARVTAFTAFLGDAARRPNLTIWTHALVTRVVIAQGRATGVACRVKGREIVVDARRDVVVSAGVLQSPKLLQLSGVGPAALLERHGLPVFVDNPAVGANLSEHMMVSLSYRLKGVSGDNREFHAPRLWFNALTYFATGRGIMANLVPHVSVMMSTRGDPAWPDVQLGIAPFSMVSSPDDKPEAGRGRTEATPGITAVAFYLRPESRGAVSIRSAAIEDPPVVDAGWFRVEADKAAALTMVKAVRDFMGRRALAPFVGEETVPGPAVQSDAQVVDALGWMLSSGLHGTGTCRVGRPDENSVVDARLRVHGVQGLRVVDCSVMPTPISGNTNGPAMAVAWRASELIREDGGAT